MAAIDFPKPGGLREARRLFRHVLKRKGLLWRAVLMLFASALLQLVFPKGAELLVDSTLNLGDPRFVDSINAICFGLLGLVVVVLVARFFEMCWFQELGEKGIADLRTETFSHLVKLPMSWYADKRAGDLTSRILADLAQIQELWIFDLRMFLTYSSIAVGGAVMLVVTSFELSLALFAVVPVVVLLAVWIGPKIRRHSALTQEKLAAGAIVVEEAMLGIQNVKAFGTEAAESRRFQRRMWDYLGPALRGSRVRSLFIVGIALVLMSTWVYMMWHGSWMIKGGKLTPGKFTSFMFYLAFSGSAAGVVAENFAKLQRAMGAHSRIVEILDAEPEMLEMPKSPPENLRGGVEFRDVGFRYPNRPEKSALNGVSFTAEPGESIALVGPSGAGKSTIAALVCRLYEPQSGEILFDGKSASETSVAWLRSQIAFVPQEVLLFGGSIGENIAYGVPEATAEQIHEAARQAHALEFIEQLPRKFDTLVGDRGAQLSGGQRQRIALARAILRNPAILVLDEATSALDSESEALIQSALETVMLGRTTFIIAHRLSTVRRATKILVLREGKIVECGPHDALYQAKGAYWHLCEQQAL